MVRPKVAKSILSDPAVIQLAWQLTSFAIFGFAMKAWGIRKSMRTKQASFAQRLYESSNSEKKQFGSLSSRRMMYR